MAAPLDSLSISGFRSIRELTDFPLRRLNVLIGANGAGKSNFIEFFRMLRAMFSDRLRLFVKEGGGDGFFFLGPRTTRELRATLKFGPYHFRFALSPVPGGEELLVKELGAVRGDGVQWTLTYPSAYEVEMSQWVEAPG